MFGLVLDIPIAVIERQTSSTFIKIYSESILQSDYNSFGIQYILVFGLFVHRFVRQ